LDGGSARRKAATYKQNNRNTEFEPTIPAFERAKTVDALDRVATVIGSHGPCTAVGRNEDKLHDTQLWCGNVLESSLLEDQEKDEGIELGLNIEK
jgi:hypothetical protein